MQLHEEELKLLKVPKHLDFDLLNRDAAYTKESSLTNPNQSTSLE